MEKIRKKSNNHEKTMRIPTSRIYSYEVKNSYWLITTYNFTKFSDEISRQTKIAEIVERVFNFSRQTFHGGNMNQSNQLKSLTTKISNARAQILKTNGCSEFTLQKNMNKTCYKRYQ